MVCKQTCDTMVCEHQTEARIRIRSHKSTAWPHTIWSRTIDEVLPNRNAIVCMWMIWIIAFGSYWHSNTKWYPHDIRCECFRWQHKYSIRTLCSFSKIWVYRRNKKHRSDGRNIYAGKYSDTRKHEKYVALTVLYETIELLAELNVAMVIANKCQPLHARRHSTTAHILNDWAYTLCDTRYRHSKTANKHSEHSQANLLPMHAPDCIIESQWGGCARAICEQTNSTRNTRHSHYNDQCEFHLKRPNRHRNHWHVCTLFNIH